MSYIRRHTQFVPADAQHAAFRRYHFQFLASSEGGFDTTLAAFEEMAEAVRDVMFTHPIHHALVTFDPTEANAHHPRQRTFIDPEGITADLLLSIFESMLQSQETLLLPGLLLTVEDLAILDPFAGGQGPGPGYKNVPAPLRGYGLSEHPWHPRWKDDEAMQARLATHCGFRALLLAHPDSVYRKDKFEEWVTEAERWASEAGCTDGKLTLAMLPSLFSEERWWDKRIVVVGLHGGRQAACFGPNWVWPDNQPPDEPDPHTVHLLLHNDHYWWIHGTKTFVAKSTGNPDRKNYPVCFRHYGHVRADQLLTHQCLRFGHHQCHLCLEVYSTDEGLKSHHSQHTTGFQPCPNCDRTTFYGEICRRRHSERNCWQRRTCRANNVPTAYCPNCFSKYPVTDEPHVCVSNGMCRNCEHQYAPDEPKHLHHCPLQSKPRFWQPLTERKSRKRAKDGVEPPPVTIWKAHWAYDFETHRHKELDPNAYELQVMAWAVRLMIPDDETARFVDENEVLTDLVRACYHMYNPDLPEFFREHISVNGTPPMEEPPVRPSIIIRGRTLQQFIYLVDNILSHEEKDVVEWHPVLWAHNGSKFDVKFVFDWYANVEGYDVSAPTYEKDYGDASIAPDGESGWKKVTYSMARKRVINMTNVGSRILSMRVNKATYKCSHAHHTCPLRNLPAIFDLPKDLVAKGEFPYELLSPDNWNLVDDRGLPPLKYYDVDSMTAKRRADVGKWYIQEQLRRGASPRYIQECLVDAGVSDADAQTWGWTATEFPDHPAALPWKFADELWAYLDNDVNVLAISMEAYHRKAVEVHNEVWEKRNIPPEHEGYEKMISPLDLSTAPGWAYAMYTCWFMPPDTVYTLRPSEHRFVRASLRGGRTDKRCNYVEVTPERRAMGDRMVYYDFKSLYPSVQKCDVHGTHFPVGAPWWVGPSTPREKLGNWLDGAGSNRALKYVMNHWRWTGFLQVDAKNIKYATHPTLHVKKAPEGMDEEKLLFPNEDIVKQTYAWPELEEAIDSGEIEVTKIHQALIFDRGTEVFGEYVRFFFDMKDNAEGKNEGLRSLAKLFLNSLWGKLGQRSYSVREWVTRNDRLDYLMEQFRSGMLELVAAQKRTPERTFFEYRVKDDISNREVTAPHIAAFVSMWGRVVLHRKVLNVHGQRALYCDTDSAIIYLRKHDRVDWCGNELGQLTNELPDIVKKAGHDKTKYPDLYIGQFVAAAPKTYALTIKHDEPHLEDRSKVVCKGFEPTYANMQSINYRTMKELMFSRHALLSFLGNKRPADAEERVFTKRLYIRENGKNVFRSRVAANQAVPVQVRVAKALTGIYTKGVTHPNNPCLVIPHGRAPPPETFLDFVDDAKHYD